jgi:hypothetical protein
MDPLPPNDPNNNQGNPARVKEVPYDGRRPRRNGTGQADGQPMDIIGDLRESPAVVIMFLMGVASYLLRERCVC